MEDQVRIYPSERDGIHLVQSNRLNASVFSEKHDRRSIIPYCLAAYEDCNAPKLVIVVCGVTVWKRFVQLHTAMHGVSSSYSSRWHTVQCGFRE